MPMICSCHSLATLSSFCTAAPNGRIQLFETMKRDGVGSLRNVVKATRLRRHTPPSQQPRSRQVTGRHTKTEILKAQARGRAVCFQMGRDDHLCVDPAALIGQFEQHPCEKPFSLHRFQRL